MARPRNQLPTYRHHKQSGQAIVTISQNGIRRDILLGKFGTPESKAEYERVLAQLRGPAGAVSLTHPVGSPDLTMGELLIAFMGHVVEHYRQPDGSPTSEVYNFKLSLRPLRDLFGHVLAVEFGPRSLKTVRQWMIDKSWCRKQINARIGRIKRAFKWAASEELIPIATFQALTTVPGLQAGRSAAQDREPILPVAGEHVEKVLPQLNRHVRGLVEFQRLTGCRPGEACRVRQCDIDTSGPIWEYKPVNHKTRWRGKTRVIAVGTKAQELLRGFFTTDPTVYLFNPRLAVEEHHAARSAARKTPRYSSHMARNTAKRAINPNRVSSERYTLDAYNQALERACERAGVPPFAPNRLRHTFATTVRQKYGLESAGASLGHAKMSATEVYAERDGALAAKVAAEIG